MAADVVPFPSRADPRAILFVDRLPSLPLVTPESAADYLGVKRHTLACWRNLGEGPPYFKFGRWIRYATADLRGRMGLPIEAEDSWVPAALNVDRSGWLLLADPKSAASFLTVSRFCLANYRREGSGPPFRAYSRRIHYAVDDLRLWARRHYHCHDPPLSRLDIILGDSIGSGQQRCA